MNQPLCIMHANCQGEELEHLLLASKEFRRQFKFKHFTNYIKEPIPDEMLGQCSVFLYQQLGAQWEELASEVLISKLSPKATALNIPNNHFRGYWPLWTSQKIIDLGDTLLNKLLDEGTPKDIILKIYLKGDITKFVDIEAALAQTIAQERAKEQICCVKFVDFFLENWRKTPAFHMVNHPCYEVLLHTANGILQNLNIAPLSKAELASIKVNPFPTYKVIEAPIHPQVAKALNLSFGHQGQEYNILGRKFTFERFVSRYIDCCQNDLAHNFLGFLQLV